LILGHCGQVVRWTLLLGLAAVGQMGGCVSRGRARLCESHSTSRTAPGITAANAWSLVAGTEAWQKKKKSGEREADVQTRCAEQLSRTVRASNTSSDSLPGGAIT